MNKRAVEVPVGGPLHAYSDSLSSYSIEPKLIALLYGSGIFALRERVALD